MKRGGILAEIHKKFFLKDPNGNAKNKKYNIRN